MIIEIGNPEPKLFVARLKGDPVGLFGIGDTAAEAIGKLILILGSADDAVNATEAVDVLVVSIDLLVVSV